MKYEKKDTMKQEILTKKNVYYTFCLRHYKIILFALMTIILLLPVLMNQLGGNMSIMGAESYYHLHESENINVHNAYVVPISILTTFLPGQWASLIPLVLAMCSLLLVYRLQKKFKIQQKYIFFFTLFFIISPAFIYTFSTISAYAMYTFLFLIGFVLVTHTKTYLKIVAFVPFILATTVDIFSTFILLFSIFMYYITKVKKKKWVYTTLFIILSILFIMNIFFQQPFIVGPFHTEQIIPDLVSDLGGISGVSFFLILLSIIGTALLWKMKRHPIYIMALFCIISYSIRTHSIFFMSIIICFFATVAFMKTFERTWTLHDVKKITFFVFFLGLAFSTLTYIDRIDQIGLSNADNEVLTWIKTNTPQDTIIFSIEENSDYIRHIADREPFSSRSHNTLARDASVSILNATYIQDLFPILEENDITLIYINQNMKERLEENQGFLFLLKNERFKLTHSHEGSEVWTFIDGDTFQTS
ncbi:hypothetical protein HOL21_00460 [Candidatus Woesearchaeota archaeon]|nr:hypothetical protein [Candidatus Woesearchaeota archaeon]MBT5396669.1 hypothetical protein [Candidatus Woesearchaeota archaeon]MBT5924386.1 hypothetical protein [Candidatus Woesearchaeota archaeon]MBT6367544.1 hypothetical protein [Candidatus Woesearchaeota archaeon]MBT7763043.1 hypothetical protein [Candidatus Woesearchaeota archaeon]